MNHRTVLHVSPHPDDEALGAPATLLGLRSAGWRIVNALASLGRPEDRVRRTAEAQNAASRAGFELVLPEKLVSISSDAAREIAHTELAAEIGKLLRSYDPALVIGPAPTDAHHGHQMVGTGLELAVRAADRPVVLWTWSIWSDLPNPTLYLPFGDQRLDQALQVLSAYGGELERNPYDRLLRGRSEANVALGSERVFGFGARVASPLPYAELLTELAVRSGALVAGEPRLVDLAEPFGSSVLL